MSNEAAIIEDVHVKSATIHDAHGHQDHGHHEHHETFLSKYVFSKRKRHQRNLLIRQRFKQV